MSIQEYIEEWTKPGDPDSTEVCVSLGELKSWTQPPQWSNKYPDKPG